MIAGAAAAHAQSIPEQGTITAYLDFDLAGADGEQSWLKGGFGKGRFGGDQPGGTSGLVVRPHLTEAGIVWQPHISWALGAVVAAVAQDGQQHPIDLSEAYLTYKPMPSGIWHLSARAGLFWPPVSLEHGGAEWAVRDSLTPSAINGWIGEEVKVVGAEASAATMIGNQRLTITGALFGFNDTAGTLLAFRGWALQDEKATAFGKQPLPPLSPFWNQFQDHVAQPIFEQDDRVGWYVKLTWRPPGPFELQAFHYDNRGDPQAVDEYWQWAWRTRFDNLGVIYDVGPHTRLIAQGMIGRTQMGYRGGPADPRTALDDHFRSAFLLATQQLGSGSASARIEAFGTHAGGRATFAPDSEDGWAFTLAGKRPLGRHATMLLEAVHIDSDRRARERIGIDPHQTQTIVRLGLRLRATR